MLYKKLLGVCACLALKPRFLIESGFLCFTLFIDMIRLYDILINEAKTPVEAVILNAIKNKQQLALYYMGDKEETAGWRRGVYPLVLASYKGKKYVRAWQEGGKTLSQVPEWKLFRLDRIRNWNASSQKTLTSPPDSRWNPNGDNWRGFGGNGFDKIISQAKF